MGKMAVALRSVTEAVGLAWVEARPAGRWTFPHGQGGNLTELKMAGPLRLRREGAMLRLSRWENQWVCCFALHAIPSIRSEAEARLPFGSGSNALAGATIDTARSTEPALRATADCVSTSRGRDHAVRFIIATVRSDGIMYVV